MARFHGAATNGGWQTQRPSAAEPDPRSARFTAPGQRPAQPGGQPGPAPTYAQPGYGDQQAGAPAYDPQAGYHYPQQPAAPAPGGQRPTLSSLEAAVQAASEYPSYPTTRPPYGQPQQAPTQPRGYGPIPGQQASPNTAGYRPAAAPSYGGQPRQPDAMPEPRGNAPGYDQWATAMPGQDPRGHDLGNYMPAGAPHPEAGFHPAEPGYHGDPLQQHAEWSLPHGGYGEVAAHEQSYAAGQLGYEQAHAGALEQAYAHDEGGDYDTDEPRRGSWLLRIAGAIVVAIGLGYGLAQGYKLLAGSAPDGATPVVKGDEAPTKTLPAEPGGKKFAHTDSKIMGRLGDGGRSPSSDADNSGPRKVATLTVGRDGSIVPPRQAPAEPGGDTGSVAVPGVTVVDGFGSQYPGAITTTSSSASAPARQPVVVKPPAAKKKPVVMAKTTPTTISTAGAASAAPSAPTKSAAATKTAARHPAKAPTGANGYVAVLASVPASDTSRLSALKRFADMQQKYGSVLRNKTPDVREANLGQKGIYHRLLVGPPGSRAQASALCGDLKAAGYKDCWVTAY